MMRKTVAKCVVAMGAGFALIVGQGCRKQAAPAPVQPAVRVPRVQPDLRVGSLPVGSLGPYGPPKVDRIVHRPAPVQPKEPERVDTETVAASQRRQDASLLLQQQVASQKQQQELNQEIEEEMKRQQEVQEEPRIQNAPGSYVPVQPPTSTPQP
jgi:hypothetical protein